MATVSTSGQSHDMGLHTEKLTNRTQQRFFDAGESANLTYAWAPVVDTNKVGTLDCEGMDATAINIRIRELMDQGCGTIDLSNLGSMHGLCVGILSRLQLNVTGSLGYFGCGLIDGPNVHISGRVGWSCGENMMAGTIVVEKNAGSTFGAAIRGGDLVCRGNVGSRTGIDQKGGTIIVGGKTGAFTGFMMQRGRMIILGDAGINLGDSMYDGTIYVGGKIEGLGVDAVPADLNDLDRKWLKSKLDLYGMEAPNGIDNIQKIVAGKQLWNYDNLEPSEKKLVL